MTGLNMTIFNVESIVHDLEYGDNGVGGATRSGENPFTFRNVIIVHTVDDIGDVSLAGRGQDDLGNAFRLKMLFKPPAIRPNPGVIEDNCVVNRVLGIIHIFWGIRIKEPNHVPVSD